MQDLPKSFRFPDKSTVEVAVAVAVPIRFSVDCENTLLKRWLFHNTVCPAACIMGDSSASAESIVKEPLELGDSAHRDSLLRLCIIGNRTLDSIWSDAALCRRRR